MDFHLINLDCASCGSAMTAGPHDILFICSHCRNGAVLGDDGLARVDSVALMPTPGRRASLWRPGWSIDAEVLIEDRRSGGRVTPGWSGRRQFVIPAFPSPSRRPHIVEPSPLRKPRNQRRSPQGTMSRRNPGLHGCGGLYPIFGRRRRGSETRQPLDRQSRDLARQPPDHRASL